MKSKREILRQLNVVLALILALSMFVACTGEPAASVQDIENNIDQQVVDGDSNLEDNVEAVSNETNTDEVVDSDVVVEEQTGVTLNYFGRASVRLDLDDGRVIYIDPYSGSGTAYQPEADLVLVTHQHTDHNVVSKVTLKEDGQVIECPYDIKSGETIAFDDITIEAVEAYNVNHNEQLCCGYIITIDDIVIYHAGDTSTTEQMESLKDYEIDYALLCMDDFYNMGPEEAMAVSDLIGAYAVIPIHTSADYSYDTIHASEYTNDNRINVLPSNALELHNISETNGVHVPLDQVIDGIMEDRLAALEDENMPMYMATVTDTNRMFYNEQERWFDEMLNMKNISFEVKSVEMLSDRQGVVTIRQSHFINGSFDFDLPLLFVYEDGQWKDHGYHFEVLETDRFIVKYMEGETKLDDFVKMLDDAYDHLALLYEEKPYEDYEMKLFMDQEMLRQRSVPSNGWVFTGWAEPDESMKLFTQHDIPYESYAGVVQHELVHHITINMCNNNLPLWVLEGIAMYDGSAYYGIENSRLLSSMTKEGVSQTIADLEARDLSQDLSQQEIYNFYSTSYMYVKFIDETYGREKLMDIFHEAGKKKFHDETMNDAFQSINQETAGEVLMTVLGLTKDELSQKYLVWLDATFN
jgi:hypothetical protein